MFHTQSLPVYFANIFMLNSLRRRVNEPPSTRCIEFGQAIGGMIRRTKIEVAPTVSSGK